MATMTIRNLSLLVLLVAALFAASGCYPAVSAAEERSALFPLTGRLTLFVEGNNGSINIHGQVGLQEVRVTATLRAWGPTQSDAEARLGSIQLEMIQNGNEVRMRQVPRVDIGIGIFRGDQVSFEIWAPADADLDLRTDNGDIHVRAVEGRLFAQTDNGNIRLESVSGGLELMSDNGNIDVEGASASLKARTANGNVAFSGRLVGSEHRVSTDNGNIHLAIPADSALHIEARVDNGSIHSSLPVTGEMERRHWNVVLNAPDGTLSITSDNGTISISKL